MELSGKLLRDGIVSGANNIINSRSSVDELNVFPVPDGDTGTNMSMTIKNALPELLKMEDGVSVSAVAAAAASGMLRGARGNSGVILSLLFRGLSKGLKGKETANAAEFAEALGKGVAAAYKSVMTPTEGTVLTVSREACEAAAKKAEETGDLGETFAALIAEGEASLARTPELLPALKKAGVVDAGGMGFLLVFKGIHSVIKGDGIIQNEEENVRKKEAAVVSAAENADISFAYSADFVINLAESGGELLKLRAYLESIGSNIALIEDEGIVKIHISTDHPGKAIEKAITYGSLTDIKIENVREQHKAQAQKAESRTKKKLEPVKPEKDMGFVAVASGAGIEAVFTDLGADCIVRGGQTSNPSTEDILEAVMATPAKTVFVLPNNKNIILAAEQTVKLADRRVVVLQTRSVPQGIAALMAFDPSLSRHENSVNMTSAIDGVSTGLVTFAVRDSVVGDKRIKQGDIIGMENGRLNVVERDITKTLYKVTKHLVNGSTSYITLFYGADVSDDDAQEAYRYLSSKLSPDIEISVIAGGQPIYYYIVSVE